MVPVGPIALLKVGPIALLKVGPIALLKVGPIALLSGFQCWMSEYFRIFTMPFIIRRNICILTLLALGFPLVFLIRSIVALQLLIKLNLTSLHVLHNLKTTKKQVI